MPMDLKLMSQDTKERIRELEGQKVILEEQLELSSSAVEMAYLDEEIFEINDTIKKLTANNGRS